MCAAPPCAKVGQASGLAVRRYLWHGAILWERDRSTTNNVTPARGDAKSNRQC